MAQLTVINGHITPIIQVLYIYIYIYQCKTHITIMNHVPSMYVHVLQLFTIINVSPLENGGSFHGL